MRFREKFGLAGWIWVALACFMSDSALVLRHTELTSTCFVILITLFQALKCRFLYWDLEPDRIRRQFFWSTEEIPWNKVTHVGNLAPLPWSSAVVVTYRRSAPLPGCGQILANPSDRQQFLAALHRFAPQATFEE
jgi:hypothetical protein